VTPLTFLGTNLGSWRILSTPLALLDVNFKCTRKCTNRLQLMDCKCEVDPTENCVFENKFMTKLIKS
jgi:hypothetical protein